jgi:hypothetical protein
VTTRDAALELSRALRTQADVEAEQRAAHLKRFGEPRIAWVTDERNGRRRKVFLPFEAEPDLAGLIAALSRRLTRWEGGGHPYWLPNDEGIDLMRQIRAVLSSYPQRSHWEYHAHGWAVSLSRSPCHFRPYTPE